MPQSGGLQDVAGEQENAGEHGAAPSRSQRGEVQAAAEEQGQRGSGRGEPQREEQQGGDVAERVLDNDEGRAPDERDGDEAQIDQPGRRPHYPPFRAAPRDPFSGWDPAPDETSRKRVSRMRRKPSSRPSG